MYTITNTDSNGKIKTFFLNVKLDSIQIATQEGQLIDNIKFDQLDIMIEWEYVQSKIVGFRIIDQKKNKNSNYSDANGNLPNLYYQIAGKLVYYGFNKHFTTLETLKIRKDQEMIVCKNNYREQTYVAKIISNINIQTLTTDSPDQEFIFKKNKNEIQIHKLLQENENNTINKLQLIYADVNYLYLLFDKQEGGTLYQYLSRRASKPTLEQIRIIMVQLLNGLKYLHSKGIMHRDIKLDNILLKEANSIEKIVITDLEYAQIVQQTPYIFQICGTPGYFAPEILKNEQYDEKCDIYSLGVALHIMLIGSKPTGCINEQIEQYENDAVDLLKHMLNEKSKRYSAQQCLNHPFITEPLEYEPRVIKLIQNLVFPNFKNPFSQILN